MTDTSKQFLLATGIGLIAGSLSGLLGVGGGVIMVPLLVVIGLNQHQAHATSLAAIVLIAAAAAIPFALEDRVSVEAAVFLAAGSLIGAPLGARLMARTPEATLKIAFGIFMIAVSARFLWPI